MATSKNNPLRDSRHLNQYLPYVDFFRRPTTADIRHPKTGQIYPRPYFWRVKNKPDGTAPDTGSEGEFWYLEDITANVADWKLLMFTTSGTQIITITGDSGGAVSGDGVGDMDLNGLVVASGTRSKPVFFTGTPASFKQDLEIQVASARTGAPADSNDAGLCSFDDTAFSVDSNGYVTLAGGAGPAIDTLVNDTGGNTVPDASGQVTVTGTSIFSDGTTANTETLNVQATANTFLYGQGANTNVAELGPLTDGQLIIGQTGGAPTAASLTGGTGITVTPGAGSITVATNLTITGDSGGALSPSSDNWNILGLGESSTSGSGSTLSILSPRCAEFVVDPTTNNGTHTTIASALSAASSGDTIFIRPGTYTENLTLKAGVFLTAFEGDRDGSVEIVGKMSASFVGGCEVSGVKLSTNADFVLEITGANATTVTLRNCEIDVDDNTAISNSGSGSSGINLRFTTMNCNTTGVAFWSITNGTLYVERCQSNNSGASSTANTFSGSQITIRESYIGLPVTTSSTANVILFGSEFESGSTNSTSFNQNSTGGNVRADYCNFRSGTATPISIGAGATLRISNCSAHHTNSTAVSGSGTLVYGSLEQTSTVGAISSSGKTVKAVSLGAVNFGDDNLANYDEGTWTPTVTGSSVNPDTVTYTTQKGKYTRIGNTVNVRCTVVINSFTLGSGAGNLQISGLPFTADSDGADIFAVQMGGINWSAGSYVVGQVQSSSTNVAFIENADNGANTVTPLSAAASGDQINFSGTYFV